MDDIFGDLKCLLYLDKIIIHALIFVHEVECSRPVFSHLRAANLKLSPEKCELCKNGLPHAPYKGVKIFVGLCLFYWRQLPEFWHRSSSLSLFHNDEGRLGSRNQLKRKEAIKQNTFDHKHNFSNWCYAEGSLNTVMGPGGDQTFSRELVKSPSI